MSNPDLSQEMPVWADRPSVRTVFPGLVLIVVICITAIVALQLLKAQLGPAVWLGLSMIELLVLGAAAVLVLGMLLKHFIALYSVQYKITSQRIFVEHGILNKRTDEVELEKYKDIFVNRDFWDKIVGCGDIEIVTSDVTHPAIKIVDVLDPITKKELIRTAARERKSSLGINRREEL